MDPERTPLQNARERYRRLLVQALDVVVERLTALPAVCRVSVFGSYARGRADLFTDLDVLVVMESDTGFIERQRHLYQLLALPVDFDLLCYTPEEFERVKDQPFLRHALRDEVVLYEKNAA